jgi:hypothetical protein
VDVEQAAAGEDLLELVLQQHCGKNSSAFVVLAVCVPDFNSEEQSVFVFQILVKLSGVWFRFNNGMEENLWREGL